MKKILFPTEFSNHAPKVLKFAIEIALANKASIVVLHAFGLPKSPSENPNFEDRTKEVMSKLKDFTRNNYENKDEFQIKFEYQAIIGPAGNVILDFAKENSIDLIVMGSQGKTRDPLSFFGSVSSRVLTEASCPVLLIPPLAEYDGFDNFTCTTDFEIQDLNVLNKLNSWAKLYEASIDCIHIIQSQKSDEIDKKLILFKELFEEQTHIAFHTLHGELMQSIEDFVTGNDSDILAMTYHHRGFFNKLVGRNLTSGIANELPVPLLVFNEI